MIHLAAIGLYVQSHLISILLAILATYAVGFLWHGPLFGKVWMKLNNLKQPKKGEMKFSMMLPGLGANFVAVFVQAAVLGRTFELVAIRSLTDALLIATILWLPFTALTIANSHAWLGKPFKLTVLDAAHYLVAIWAVAAVLYQTM